MNNTNKKQSESRYNLLINKYFSYLKRNGITGSITELNRRLSARGRAFFYRKIFLDKVGSIGTSPYIRGLSGIKIGDNFNAGRFIWLESVIGEGSLRIGNNVTVSDFVHIACSNFVTIGDDVLIGSKVLITDHSHGEIHDSLSGDREILAPNLRPIISKGPVNIERAVWIGDGCCILAAVDIGEGSIIGANSVVVCDIPPRTVWGGVPAEQLWPKLSTHNDGSS